jgi:hypothetical protein
MRIVGHCLVELMIMYHGGELIICGEMVKDSGGFTMFCSSKRAAVFGQHHEIGRIGGAGCQGQQKRAGQGGDGGCVQTLAGKPFTQ